MRSFLKENRATSRDDHPKESDAMPHLTEVTNNFYSILPAHVAIIFHFASVMPLCIFDI